MATPYWYFPVLLMLALCTIASAANPLLLGPTTIPAAATQPTKLGVQSARVVFAKKLSGDRRVEIVRKEIIAKPRGEPTPGFEEFFEPITILAFRLTLWTPDGSGQELYNNILPWSMMAHPSEPKYLDVAVSPSGDLAVVIWNELGFVWAEVLVRDIEGQWKALARKPFGDPQGKNSLAPEARSAEISIDEQNGVTLSLVHADGSRNCLQLRRVEEALWEKVKGDRK